MEEVDQKTEAVACPFMRVIVFGFVVIGRSRNVNVGPSDFFTNKFLEEERGFDRAGIAA